METKQSIAFKQAQNAKSSVENNIIATATGVSINASKWIRLLGA